MLCTVDGLTNKFEMMDSEFEEFEIKTEIEIEIEDWKPPDVSDVSGTNNQNPLLHSHLNELENLNDFVNTSKGPMIKLEGLYF